MIGAHLDSVPEGPGIVDNGSGVASLLEIATGSAPTRRCRTRYGLRFRQRGGRAAVRPGTSMACPTRPPENPDVPECGHGGLPERRLLRSRRERGDSQTAGPDGSATIAQVLAAQLASAGVTAPEIVELSATTNLRSSRPESRSAAPRTATPKRRRPGRPTPGAGRRANPTTGATTRPVTASTTSTERCSATICEHGRHPRPLCDVHQ